MPDLPDCITSEALKLHSVMRVYPLSFCAFVNFISVKYIDAERQFYCYNLTVKLIFYLNLLSGKRNARMRFVGYIINPVSK